MGRVFWRAYREVYRHHLAGGEVPKFWIFLTRRWLQLPDHLSWSWWRALGKSPWSQCADLRTCVLNYDGHPFVQQRPEAERQHLQMLLEPGQLLQVIDSLVRQKLLLKRDGAQIEEAILKRLDATGEWV